MTEAKLLSKNFNQLQRPVRLERTDISTNFNFLNMLQNYLKLAWRVLWRRKFFTFISLFGISFTLMSLMLFTAAFQTELGSKAPMSKQSNLVIFDRIELRMDYFDTIPVVDSSLVNGAMVYDTTSFKHESAGSSISTNSVSRSMFQDYYSDLKSASNRTVYSTDREFDIFKNNTKIGISANYTDANFWEVFDFNFIEGQGFSEHDFKQEAQKAVISEVLAMKYFGRINGIVGNEIEVDGRNYSIVGVVEKPNMTYRPIQCDFYTPYSLRPKTEHEKFYGGSFNAVFVARNDFEAVKKEIKHRNTLVPTDREAGYNQVNVYPWGYVEDYAQSIWYDKDAAKSLKVMKFILIGLLSLFIILPTLNLINLNVSRILDRSSEIGVRKAFGADRSNIIWQFVFENVVLTMIGGVIGFVLAYLLINVINSGGLLGKATLAIDLKFGIYAFLITIFFGIVSGLLPAWKISKTQIVNALKTNQL